MQGVRGSNPLGSIEDIKDSKRKARKTLDKLLNKNLVTANKQIDNQKSVI